MSSPTIIGAIRATFGSPTTSFAMRSINWAPATELVVAGTQLAMSNSKLAPKARQMPVQISSIRLRSRSLTSESKLRIVPSRTARSEITLPLLPLLRAPTVTTAVSEGLVFRATMLCSATTS